MTDRDWGRWLIAPAIVSLVCFSSAALAYDVSTHRQISRAAVAVSFLKQDPTLLQSIGLGPVDARSFPNSHGNLMTIERLIEFGSIEEDRILPDARSLHHFYDPVSDRPLTVSGIPLGHKSPSWALEGQGDIVLPMQNHSYRDANRYYEQALTLQDRSDRARYWGLFFQTIGHVIHHIQDMAQPQHVRNDAHLPLPIVGDESWYERYTRDNAAKLAPHLISQLNRKSGTVEPVSLWADAAGSGLAQFTNRNFFSKDTLYRWLDGEPVPGPYAAPVPEEGFSYSLEQLGLPNAEALCESLKTNSRLVVPPNTTCVVRFYRTAVSGASGHNQRAASLSVFDQYLADVNGAVFVGDDKESPRVRVDRLFTLNRFNFESAYLWLMPRAMGYSAGLIDSFFPTRLSLQRPTELTPGSLQIAFKADLGGPVISDGIVSVYADAPDGRRHELVVRSGKRFTRISTNTGHLVSVDAPADADWAEPRKLLLVVKGRAYEREAIGALVIPVTAQQHGLIVQPTFPTADRVSGPRLLTREGAAWQLSSSTGFATGNTDWKGQYAGGIPQRVLSWHGSKARSIGVGSSPNIYQYGTLFAVAPANVRGAAIIEDSSRNEWLLVVANDGSGDVLYRKRNALDRSPALRDPESAPHGWEEVPVEWPSPSAKLDATPWFFNGNGDAAQTIRSTDSPEATLRARLKLAVNIDASTASVSDLGNEFATVTGERSVECGDQVIIRSSSRTSGDSIIAVDYVDDQEVLGRALVDSWSERTESSYQVRPHYYSFSFSDDASIVLDVLGAQTPVQRITELSTPERSERTAVQALVEFWDLRTNTVVLKRESRHTVMSATFGPDYVDRTWADTVGPQEHLIHVDGGGQTFHSETAVTQTSQFRDTLDTGGRTCTSSSSATFTYPVPVYSWNTTTHNKVGFGAVNGVIASDREGRVFAAIHYATGGQSRVFTYLTGGSVEELFGASALPVFSAAGPK